MSQAKVYKWSAIDRIGNSVITFTGNLIFARLLDPSDFGLLAMVAIFSAIAYNLSSSGLSDGLIHKLRPTERDYSTVFVFNSGMGLFFCILFLIVAQPLARFFGHYEIRNIMWATGLCLFFSTLSFVQETRMRKELKMKEMAFVRLSASLSSLVLGVGLVLAGFSYWGLVSTRIFVNFFTCTYYIIASRWMPRIAFYWDTFREMFGYGVHLMIAYIMVQISRNINTMVLGKFSTPALSGAYSQGQKIEEVPFSVTEAVFNSPFFAIVSNAEAIDEKRKLSSQMNINLFALNLTVGLFMFLVSWPAFNFLYGSKWDVAIPVFQILLIYGICTAMKYFYQTIMKVHARTKTVRNLTIIEVALQLVLLVIFYNKGIIMIALTQVIAAIVTTLAHAVYYKRLQSISITTLFSEYYKAACTPLVTALVTWILAFIWKDYTPAFISCLIYTIVFVTTFAMVAKFLKPPYYDLVMSFVKVKIFRQ